jgi:hypothetical protein
MNRWSSPFDDDAVRPPAHPSGNGCWVLLFACGLLIFGSALFWMSQGRFFDSEVYRSISESSWQTIDDSMPAAGRSVSAVMRLYGSLGICAGLLIMAVAAKSYRRRETWAWYVFWVLPLCATLDFATFGAYSALTLRNAAWDLVLLTMSLIALIVPYQAFFPTPTPTPTRARERSGRETPVMRSSRAPR